MINAIHNLCVAGLEPGDVIKERFRVIKSIGKVRKQCRGDEEYTVRT